MNSKQIGLARLALINARNNSEYVMLHIGTEHPDENIRLKLSLAANDISQAVKQLKSAINRIVDIQTDLAQYEKEQTK